MPVVAATMATPVTAPAPSTVLGRAVSPRGPPTVPTAPQFSATPSAAPGAEPPSAPSGLTEAQRAQIEQNRRAAKARKEAAAAAAACSTVPSPVPVDESVSSGMPSDMQPSAAPFAGPSYPPSSVGPPYVPYGPSHVPSDAPSGPSNVPSDAPPGPSDVPSDAPSGPSNVPSDAPPGPSDVPSDAPSGLSDVASYAPPDVPPDAPSNASSGVACADVTAAIHLAQRVVAAAQLLQGGPGNQPLAQPTRPCLPKVPTRRGIVTPRWDNSALSMAEVDVVLWPGAARAGWRVIGQASRCYLYTCPLDPQT